MKAIWIAIVLAAVAGARAEAKGCHETSYVVGLQHCSWFGKWSRDADVPRLWIDLGYFHHAYTSQPYTLGAEAMTTHETPNQFATSSSGIALRILGGIGDVFYTGLELQPGWIDKVPTVPGPIPNDNEYFGMHWIAGVHASLFRFAGSAELAAGFRYEDFSYCPQKACISDASQDRRELDARARIDAFITPEFSIGAMFGKSLIDADDYSMMLNFSIHVRAMDGMR